MSWQAAGAGAQGVIGGLSGMFSRPGADTEQQSATGLQRAQWNEYMGTFMPEEQKLIGMLSTPQSVQQDVSAAEKTAGQADTAAQQATQRRLASYGVPIPADQQAEMNRQTNVSSTLDQVAAANNERQTIANRDMKIMAGS